MVNMQPVPGQVLSGDFEQPSQLYPVSFKDKGKFVPTSDISDLGQKIVVEKIAKIQSILSKSALELKAIQEAFLWRTALPADFNSYRDKLRAIQIEHERQAEKLHGISGVNTLVASVTDKGSIPGMLRQIQQLELELLLTQKTRRWLEAICESAKFREEYTYCKQITPGLYETLTNVETLTPFVSRLDEIITDHVALLYPGLQHLPRQDDDIEAFIQSFTGHKAPKNPDRAERLKIRARKELFLQMLELCKHIAAEKVGDSRLENRLKGLNPLIDHIKKDLGRRTVSEAVRAIELSTLPRYTNKEYSFWHKTPTGSQTWFSRWGSYPQSGSIGTMVQSEVAERLPNLLAQLKARLTEICQGNLDSPHHDTLKNELDHYQSSLAVLETEFDKHFDVTYVTHYDTLVPILLDYGYGLEYTFTQVRALLKLAYKSLAAPSMAIFKTINEFERYCSEYEELTELARTFQAYHAMKQMKLAEEANHLKESRKSFNSFLERTSTLLREVHAKKGPEMLELTDSELLVPTTLLSQNSLTSLYTRGSDREILPLDVLSYISKRAIQSLYLPGATHNIELELVLYVIRQRFAEPLQKSFEIFEDCKEIIDAYEKHYSSRRLTLEYDLKPASIITHHALRSAQSSEHILDFACALQKHLEYLQSGVIVEDMKTALSTQLEEAASLGGYVPIYPEVASKALDFWQFDNPVRCSGRLEEAAEKLRVEIPSVTDQERMNKVFKSIFLRLLSASLFAKDLDVRLLAQQQIKTIVEEQEYDAYIENLPDEIKQLLCESALDKILVTSFTTQEDLASVLTDKEKELLLHGPIAQFFLAETISTDIARLPLALYKLISVENHEAGGLGELATRFIACKGELCYERWIAGYDALLQGSPLSSVELAHFNE